MNTKMNRPRVINRNRDGARIELARYPVPLQGNEALYSLLCGPGKLEVRHVAK